MKISAILLFSVRFFLKGAYIDYMLNKVFLSAKIEKQ